MASEQQLARLGEFNFILVGDKSSSMGEEDMPGGQSRWDYMQESMMGFARDVAKFDSDGLGLVLFGGSEILVEDNCDVNKIKSVCANTRPNGGTPLAQALTAAIGLAKKADKKSFIVVYTDGVPDDKKAAADVIRKQANAQATDDELTILFIQVAKDPRATEYLRKLDDDLTGAKFDIVDAKTMEEVEKFPSTADLVLTAIED